MTSYEHSSLKEANIKVIGVGDSGDNMLNNMDELKKQSMDIVRLNDADVQDGILNLLSHTDMVVMIGDIGDEAGLSIIHLLAEKIVDSRILSAAVITSHVVEGHHTALVEEKIVALNSIMDAPLIISGPGKSGNNNNNHHHKVSLAVQAIADMITKTDYSGTNFLDIRSVLKNSHGETQIGFGVAKGKDMAIMAAKSACNSLQNGITQIHSSKMLLVNVAGGKEMTLGDYDDVINTIAHPENSATEVIYSLIYNPYMNNEISVTMTITGI